MTTKSKLHASSAFGYWGGDTQSGIFRRMIPMFAPEGGEGGSDSDPDDEAAKAAAEKTAAEKAAAEKAAEAAARAAKTDDEVAKLLKEVMTLKNKLKAEVASKEELTKKFDGLDPEQMRQVLADAQKAEEEKLRAAGDFDSLKKRMAEEHQREIAKVLADKTAATSELDKLKATIAELTVGAAFAQSAFLKDETVLTPSKARRVYEDHFDIEDGQVVAYDNPRGSATRTPLVDARGLPLPFDEAMRRIVEADPDRDHLLRAKSKPGAGVTNNPNLPQNAGRGNTDAVGVDRIAAALAAKGVRKGK